MISVKVGHPGEGKSSTTSLEIRRWLDQGIHVYTNLHLNESRHNYHYFDTAEWKVIFKLQDGIIVFDEGQFILDSRQWQDTPVEFRHLLQKGRHEGLDFYILTQNIMQIDVAARRLIHEAKKVVKLFSWRRFNLGWYMELEIDISGLDKEKITSVLPKELWVMTKKDFEYYDSHALRTILEPPQSYECTVATCKVRHKIYATPPQPVIDITDAEHPQMIVSEIQPRELTILRGEAPQRVVPLRRSIPLHWVK